MAEHLAIVAAPALRRLLRKRTLSWKRRRREAPIGRVRQGDRVFVKTPGGPVLASGLVTKVREERKGREYLLYLHFRGLRKIPVPFPVVKRDRRSWVVCAPPRDARQQALITTPPPSVRDLLRAVHAGRRRVPSRRTVTKLLAHLARQHRAEGSMLLWLAFLAVLSEGDGVADALQEYAHKPARHVVPFAVFS